MSNADNALGEQLAAIQAQLQELMTQIEEVKTQVSPLQQLSKQVTKIEQRLLAVGDLYRYEQLQDYLADHRWYEADQETIRLIQDIEGVANLEDLRPDDIRKFPCGQLQVLDQLWQTYSDERFGFSVQLRIYQELGGTLDTTIAQDQTLVEKWGDRLGWREGDRWRKCHELDFSLEAPLGCHPSGWWNSPYGSKMTNYFLARLLTCEQ
ncbi:Ycf53-like protein [Acaryochloris thomasi RCC1774]|uniref:Ycf53-like protein n=1 Tax=Acaryochloris thomasi RCC1774 TaxID=1764569 RepID=A0A2W1JYM5_9CYAN|nr:GUN4 domain-containing protein [Acaryochloris thomasi]PZD73297.1 Ycf53-like protein [Acaryochloris thomasi RCC1774]